MDEFNNEFYNPETELEDKYSNEIHLHRVSRGTRKCDIIIKGLIFKTKKDEKGNIIDESKEFIKLVTKKFGICGCYKIVEEYDEKNKVYVFSGDKRDDIVKILVEKYNRDAEFIIYHG